MKPTPWIASLAVLGLSFSFVPAVAAPGGAAFFFPNPAYIVNGEIRDGALGNANGDDFPDLAVLVGEDGGPWKITVYYGRGQGTFEAGPTFEPAGYDVDFADLDHDGRDDLIELGINGALLVRISRGNGFHAPVPAPGSYYGDYSVEEGDVNGDSHTDLVVREGAGFRVTLNQGDGSFAPSSFVPGSGPAFDAFRIADFNNDGRMDIVTSAVSVYLRTPSGGYAPPVTSIVPAGTYDLELGDLNSDGFMDVISVASDQGTASGTRVLLGQGNGSFVEAAPLPPAHSPHVRVLDFDGNGIPDVAMDSIVANRPGGNLAIRLLAGRGDGTFHPPIEVTAGSNRGLLTGDLNDDGWVDLVGLGSRSKNAISVLLNGPDHLFGRRVLGDTPGGAIFKSDLNGDGRDDLLAAGSAITVLRRSAAGGFEGPLQFAGSPAADTHHLGTLLDADGDGHPDVAMIDTSFTTVSRGLGDGAFAPPTSYTSGERYSITGIDFDADGDDDILTGCLNSICVRTALGDGTYSTDHFRILWEIGGLIAADLNLDGRKDLVGVASRNTPPASFIVSEIQQPDGSFQEVDAVPAVGQPLAIDDVNADGVPDILLAHSAGIGVMLGTGGGHFAAPIDTASRPAASLATADFDSDGHLDVATLDSGDGWNVLEILLGDGAGRFPRSQLLVSPDDTSLDAPHLVVGEFNDDAFLDLAFPSRSGAVTLYFGTGIPTLPYAPVAAAGADQTIPCESPGGGMVLLDGSASTDGDSAPGTNDDIASFDWYTAYGTPQAERIASTEQASIVLPPGTHVVTLVTTDASGRFSEDQVLVTLDGALCVADPPLAAAGPDHVVECQSAAGAAILLDGEASTDADSTAGTNDDIVLFEWFEGYGLPQQAFLGSGQQLAKTLSFGPHVVTLRTTDRWGLSDTDDLLVTVQDTAPPELTAAIPQATLWPPNHRMVPVSAVVSAVDQCGAVNLSLTGIGSSEPDDDAGPGDGATIDDVQHATPGVFDASFELRAERAAGGAGRVYTITYLAADLHGNTTSRALTVTVPHDLAGVTEPLILRMRETSWGTVAEWDAVPGAIQYNVVVGDLAALRSLPAGSPGNEAVCLARGITGLDTSGSEINFDPDVGQAYFILVEYDDGPLSGFGTESAPYDRSPVALSGCP